ncbi:hypothetical protein WA026_011924 [Henosepilachna vigintioctopunctata]|uniref:Guanine nucleotide-binding protein subunit beta-like protein 1 n=1 Tax=Henosepilachna vigintioctopunctata TaxID=420089 RepID=A0AAW1UDF9_9CUCU
MGHSIQALHASHDYLITQEKSGIVKLWSLQESHYQMTNSIETYGGFCKSLVVKPNLIVPQEKSLDIVHLRNMEKTRTLYTEVDSLGCIMCITQVVINNKDYILGAYESGDIFLWSLEAAKLVSRSKLDEYPTTITFDSSKGTGIAASVKDFLQIFDINANTLEITLGNRITIPNQGVNIVKIREDSRIFVVGCWDNCIRYFNWKNFRCLAVLNEHTEPITDIKFSPYPVKQWDSNIMAAGSQDGVISLWNLYS